jgi:iron complex transport system substrate-binding protein
MKKYRYLLAASALTLMLAACNADEAEQASATEEKAATEESTEEVAEEVVVDENATQKVTYLGTEYEVPAKVETIVAASLESMEDAAVLGIKPVGVVSNDGETIPSYLAKELEGATVVGTKKEPSAELMLTLNPDVILGISRWDEAQMMTYNKVATTFPYSHISTNWKENLALLGQLTGKEAEAEAAIAQYEEKLAAAREQIQASDLKDKKIVLIRLRDGMAVYPETIFLNPSVYADLGFNVPEELGSIEQQTVISHETLAEWNPDIVLIQVEDPENAETSAMLEEVLNNNIFKGITASKNEQVYVNIVDPMAQGGTAWSKINFLDAFMETVIK